MKQNTKHTLQILEERNQKIENEEVSLEGVAIVTLDVESMTDELARVARAEFWMEEEIVTRKV